MSVEFKVTVGRFLAPWCRRMIRDVAFDHGVDVEFDEERGFASFDLYVTLSGDPDDCDAAWREIEATIEAYSEERA